MTWKMTSLLTVAALALFVAPASGQGGKLCSQCTACDSCNDPCVGGETGTCGVTPFCRQTEFCATAWCETVPAETPCTLNDGVCAATTCGAFMGESPEPPGWIGEPLEFFHQDALGSVRLVTNEQGQVIRHDYLPFGEEIPTEMGRPTTAGYGGFDTTPQRFTGKERDTESNLDYFGARYYSGAMGRFVSLDPVITWNENIVDPQRWNRYSYVRNSPTVLVDPDGRVIDTILDAGFIAYDVIDIGTTLYSGGDVSATQWEALGADVLCAVIPVATGGGLAVRAAAKAAERADKVVDAVRAADKLVDAEKTADRLADAGRALGDEVAGPYAHIPDHPSVGAGKKYTTAQRQKILDANKQRNGGVLRSDKSGTVLMPHQQSKRGVRHAKNEAHVDHRKARCRGGSNSNCNAQVLSREENLGKGAQ